MTDTERERERDRERQRKEERHVHKDGKTYRPTVMPNQVSYTYHISGR